MRPRAPLPHRPASLRRQAACVAAFVATLAAAGAGSAAPRDPFQPPPGQRPAPGAAYAAPAAPPMPVVRHLVTVDGRRWVLDRGRRLGVGDRLGGMRIECIHDDGATVRDGAGRLQHLALFDRVQVRPAGTPPTRHAACADAAPQTHPRRADR